MNKENIFRSSKFYMSEGDVLHMIIKDEQNVPLTVALYGESSEETPEADNVYDDWYLPSIGELAGMQLRFGDTGLGGYQNSIYLSSTEFNATQAWGIDFSDGLNYNDLTKSSLYYVRACRKFTDIEDFFHIGDIGPAGGTIFEFNGTDRWEAAATDQSSGYVWSNVDNIEIGVTAQDLNIGQVNTAAIIGQPAHVNSAAKICDDLIV